MRVCMHYTLYEDQSEKTWQLTGRGPGPSAVHMAPLEQLSGRGRVTRPHNNDYTQNRVHWGKTITAHRCAQALYIST